MLCLPATAFLSPLRVCVSVCVCACARAKLLQLCSTLCNPMECSPPGSSVHVILQVRIMKWVATPSSRGSSSLGIKPVSLVLQADSLQLSYWGSPGEFIKWVVSALILSFLCRNFVISIIHDPISIYL